MGILVTDQGFARDDWQPAILTFDQLRLSDTGGHAVSLAPDFDLDLLVPYLNQVALIRVEFAHFADGRGFSLAPRLRALGFAGRLRAAGHILADQYRNARRAGFDEVEIDPGLAARQPEPQWRVYGDWRKGDYRLHLRGTTGQEPGAGA